MIIALAGFRGFIGSHLRKRLEKHELILLERGDLYGDTAALAQKISGCDILINTAGFSVSKRWTNKNRKRIRESRVRVTANLVQSIEIAKNKPAMFLNASAIGIYQHNMEHTETSGNFAGDFLSEVVQEWEAATNNLSSNVKLVKMRLGMVLGADGGALPRLFRLFKWGLGGVIASGKQVYSFIHIEDVTGAVEHIIKRKGEGIYNFTAPYPVSNRTFTHVLKNKLNRPAFLPVPRFLMRIVMGKASSIVTEGQTVYPKKLLDEGYKFTFATIDDAIENLADQQ